MCVDGRTVTLGVPRSHHPPRTDSGLGCPDLGVRPTSVHHLFYGDGKKRYRDSDRGPWVEDRQPKRPLTTTYVKPGQNPPPVHPTDHGTRFCPRSGHGARGAETPPHSCRRDLSQDLSPLLLRPLLGPCRGSCPGLTCPPSLKIPPLTGSTSGCRTVTTWGIRVTVHLPCRSSGKSWSRGLVVVRVTPVRPTQPPRETHDGPGPGPGGRGRWVSHVRLRPSDTVPLTGSETAGAVASRGHVQMWQAVRREVPAGVALGTHPPGAGDSTSSLTPPPVVRTSTVRGPVSEPSPRSNSYRSTTLSGPKCI